MFEAFHQVDGGTTRQFSGTGLGLAICRNLATTLGGSLELQSAVGVGSTFTLRLPLVLPERPESASQPSAYLRPAALADATLLVVESNPVVQGMVRTLFEADVAKVVMVSDGEAALAELARGQVDHLLVEGQSASPEPGERIAVIRRLIETAGRTGLSSTILFAVSDDLPIAELAQVGATQMIMKPVGGRQLVQLIRDCYAETGNSPLILVAEAA